MTHTGLGGASGQRYFSSDDMPTSWSAPESLTEYMQREIDDDFEVSSDLKELAERNESWREEMLAKDPEYFKKLGSGQSPKYLWIGCCDSRVAVENMAGGMPGEIFVHRNIANMVVATDPNLRAALQYAVNFLEVEHVVVCGHYECGGVRAAVTNRDHTAPLESWLSNIRDVYRLHQAELDEYECEDERHKRLVELNVVEQCVNLFKTADVQRRRAYTAARPHKFDRALPRVHGMVFSPGDGILRKLPIDFRKELGQLEKVYNLYKPEDLTSMTAPS
jgi:carbonic anhydrase